MLSHTPISHESATTTEIVIHNHGTGIRVHETIITALDRQMLALVRENLIGYVAFSQLHFGLGDKLDFR